MRVVGVSRGVRDVWFKASLYLEAHLVFQTLVSM